MKDVQNLNSQIIEISSKVDSTVKEITMLVHKLNHVNENGLDFLKEYVEINMNSLVDKPVVCKYNTIKDDLGGHEQVVDPKTGKIIELRTIAIGTITDVWINKMSDEEDSLDALYAKATIWSYKYPKIMECIERLYSDGVSTSSVEVEIYGYGENPTKEYRYGMDFTYIGNCLLGSNVPPADTDAGVLSIGDKEIAMAIMEDLENIEVQEKGDLSLMPDKQILFNKGMEIRYHETVEVNSLKWNDVSNSIYNQLNPINPQTGDRKYNYYICDCYTDCVVVEDWNDYKTLFRIGYTVNGDNVVLDEKENWIQGKMGFIPDGVDMDQIMKDMEDMKTMHTVEMNNKIQELNDQHKEVMQVTEEQIKELQEQLEVATSKIEELSSTIVAQEESKLSLESTITELNQAVEELKPFKENFEKAEMEKKQQELSEKYSKLLSSETQATEEFKTAVSELNSTALNEMVVAEVSKAKSIETEVSTKNENVVVTASKQEDLFPTDKKSYWHSSKVE